MSEALVDALLRAVDAAPDDVELRVHLGEVLVADGRGPEAVAQAAAALARDPSHAGARELITRAMAGPPVPVPDASPGAAPAEVPAPATAPDEPRAIDPPPIGVPRFDWTRAEGEVGDIAGPRFVEHDEPANAEAFDVQRSTVTLADVGGMTEVKQRLEASFLAPMRNPELRRLYRTSLRGGLMLYGPPGCGKTFLARAVAGELGAKFLSVGVTDVLDPYAGGTERNLREVFQLARRSAPCVLFFDEIDALGQRRSANSGGILRGMVNQLLIELDGVDGANEGVFVLAATNQPWDVDNALRRPGRLDRTLLVLPPDAAAREAIFRSNLLDRPVESIDLVKLAKDTDGLSGADIAYVCQLASEQALLDGARTGNARLMTMADVVSARREVRPSTGPWFETARNVVVFGDGDGTYRELRDHLKKTKRL